MAAARTPPRLFILPTLGAAAYFFAQGTTTLLGAHWLAPSDLPIARPPVTPPPHAQRPSPPVAALFDERPRGPGDPPPLPPTEPCDASLRLVGTVTDEDVGGESAAAILVGARHATVRVGDAVAGWTVASIGAEHLELEGEGRDSCRLALFGVRNRGGDAPTSPEALEPAAAQPLADRLERDRLQAILRNPEVLGPVRVVPVGGRPALYGIRRGSPLAELGLRNGDRILSVGGLEVATADNALAAYARLRRAENVTLRLLRRGEERTFSYRIE